MTGPDAVSGHARFAGSANLIGSLRLESEAA
jgi:hypothetical protein